MGEIDYKAKIHRLNVRLAKLKCEKRKKEDLIKKKKRRARAGKLLKLGIIFEITSTDIYDREIIMEHLERFKKLETYELELLNHNGSKVLEKISLSSHDKEECLYLSTPEKKKRNHKLISLGALFEKSKMDKYPLAILVGYIETLHNYSEDDFKEMLIEGKKYF